MDHVTTQQNLLVAIGLRWKSGAGKCLEKAVVPYGVRRKHLSLLAVGMLIIVSFGLDLKRIETGLSSHGEHKLILRKEQFWNKLVDYYYDEIHWQKNTKGIYEWLELEYNAISDTGSQVIEFTDNKKATWFLMKHST